MPHKPETAHLLQGVVLLAEDNPVIRAVTAQHMEQMGLTVLQAEDSEQAVEIALMQRPDIVLMDMEMPVIAGADAARTLRMRGFRAPILALTAHKRKDEQSRALAAGCDIVVEKPQTPATLRAALALGATGVVHGR